MGKEKKAAQAAIEELDTAIEKIKTKDGTDARKVELSDGRVAIVRRLKGRDMVETRNIVKSDKSLDFETVNMSVATEIDGKRYPPEHYLDEMYQADYALISVAYAELNF